MTPRGIPKIVRAGTITIAPSGDTMADGFEFTPGTPLQMKQLLIQAHVRSFLDHTLRSGEIRIIIEEPAYPVASDAES